MVTEAVDVELLAAVVATEAVDVELFWCFVRCCSPCWLWCFGGL